MLNGKVALVTGASRGIGREIALTLAEYGAAVAIQGSVADYAACGNMIAQTLNTAVWIFWSIMQALQRIIWL